MSGKKESGPIQGMDKREMTNEKKKLLKEFEEKLNRTLDEIPSGLLQEKPRFQLSGEIIPESLLRQWEKDTDYSEKS